SVIFLARSSALRGCFVGDRRMRESAMGRAPAYHDRRKCQQTEAGNATKIVVSGSRGWLGLGRLAASTAETVELEVEPTRARREQVSMPGSKGDARKQPRFQGQDRMQARHICEQNGAPRAFDHELRPFLRDEEHRSPWAELLVVCLSEAKRHAPVERYLR